MNKDQYKSYKSLSGFTYDFSISKINNEILIFQKDMGFSFAVANGKIDWNQYPQNTALLSSDVIEAANEFAKYCHLLVFA